MGDVIKLADYRPHVAGVCFCRGCGRTHVSVHPESADETRLECPHCKVCDSVMARRQDETNPG
jgi:hypothetical protein